MGMMEASTLEEMAFDFVVAEEDQTRCIEAATDASAIENEAMLLDRRGPPHGATAAALYRRAADRLLEAAGECAEDHPDRAVLEEHAREVTMRADYLDGLQGAPAVVPLEDHIRAVTLTMGACSQEAAAYAEEVRASLRSSPSQAMREMPGNGDKKVMGAAAAVAAGTGLLLMGPLSAVALGVGAAYASTREDKAGSAVRKVGKVGVKAVHQAKVLDEEYRITTKAMTVGQSAFDQVRGVGAKYGIAGTAKETGKALHSFNEKHKVTKNIGWGISSAGSALSGLVSKATR